MDLNEMIEYWDLRSKGYSQNNLEEYYSDQKITWQNLLKENAPHRPCLRCLDIGCGPGFMGIVMAELGHIVTGIDLSPEMLGQAEINSCKAGIHVRYLLMDAQKLDFRDNIFDYIFCRNLTWLLESPETAYKEWYRVLAPSGRIFIADSNFYYHYYNKDYQEWKEHYHADDHPSPYGVNPKTIKEIAKKLPMSKVERPAWDVGALINAGFVQITTNVKSVKFFSEKDQREKQVIDSFWLTADKQAVKNKKASHKKNRRVEIFT